MKTKTILNLTKSGLSNEVITSLKPAINKTKGELVDSNDIKMAQSFDYGYIFLIFKLMKDLRVTGTLERSFGGGSNIIQLFVNHFCFIMKEINQFFHIISINHFTGCFSRRKFIANIFS